MIVWFLVSLLYVFFDIWKKKQPFTYSYCGKYMVYWLTIVLYVKYRGRDKSGAD